MFDFDHLNSVRCPWLLIQGDADEIVDANSVINWVSTLNSPPELEVVADCGHFFHGRLIELRSICDGFLESRVVRGHPG
jgi:hypothetical protein